MSPAETGSPTSARSHQSEKSTDVEDVIVDERSLGGDTLSLLANNVSAVEEMSDKDHIEMLAQAKEKAIADGYMLEPTDFDNLHYEDPKVTQLKQTDVRDMRCFSCFFFFQKCK